MVHVLAPKLLSILKQEMSSYTIIKVACHRAFLYWPYGGSYACSGRYLLSGCIYVVEAEHIESALTKVQLFKSLASRKIHAGNFIAYKNQINSPDSLPQY
ncbi:Transposase [Fusarium oxysporum f. sp. albedinis]|nr:Transposase [Fusarium oxysporum f. sp. albedinis]